MVLGTLYARYEPTGDELLKRYAPRAKRWDLVYYHDSEGTRPAAVIPWHHPKPRSGAKSGMLNGLKYQLAWLPRLPYGSAALSSAARPYVEDWTLYVVDPATGELRLESVRATCREMAIAQHMDVPGSTRKLIACLPGAQELHPQDHTLPVGSARGLAETLARALHALHQVYPYALSRGEDLVAGKEAGEEDPTYPGADIATERIEAAASFLQECGAHIF